MAFHAARSGFWRTGDFACSRPSTVRRDSRAIQKAAKSSYLLCLRRPLLRHGATAAGRGSVSAPATRRLPRPPRCALASASLRQHSCRRLLQPGPLRAPLLPLPVASLAACEREGARRCRRRRAEGVPVRGARRVAVGGAQRDQARVPAPRAQVPPGRQQGARCSGEVFADQARLQHSDELRESIQVREQQFRFVLVLQLPGEQISCCRRAVLWICGFP